MKNSEQHLGNEANLATFSLSRDVIFLMVSPLLGKFWVSFNSQSAIRGLQSVVCSLESAVCSLQSAVFSLRSAFCSLQMSYTAALSKSQAEAEDLNQAQRVEMSIVIGLFLRFDSTFDSDNLAFSRS